MFLPEDPGGAEAQRKLEAQGKVPIVFGLMWFKGQHMGTGQVPVKKYNRALRDLIMRLEGNAEFRRLPRTQVGRGLHRLRALRRP